MLREKLVVTLAWAAACIACAMTADYFVSIVFMNDPEGYTPLTTFLVATLVTLPSTYALVSGRLDLRKARDELAAARDAALAADRAKSQFFSNMSHELRTPLNAILGFSELLGLEGFASRRAEYAELIHRSGRHLLSLVDDLLDLSRIEAERLELRFEALQIEDLIDECVQTVALRLRDRQLRLTRRVDPDLPSLDADRRAVKQILLNLLTNAVKFSNAGGEITIAVCAVAAGGLSISVRDSGIGIAAADQARVFERFGQARHDVSIHERGAGLGLPIVRGLVEAHGGRVSLESTLGEGTCVSVWLPPARLTERRPVALAS
ncbi:MAG: HAMP domain-containing sensor histidine kinase [Rhizomicrobium sp.]